MTQNNRTPHFYGHRKRLKEKFLKTTSGNFADYELLELVLFWSVPRRDVKPLAKELLRQFGSLAGIIYADKDKLFKIISTSMYVNLKIIKEVIYHVLQHDVINKNVLSSWNALIDYLKTTMGYIKTEQLRILFLNNKNILIADELQSSGTVDQTSVYPREVVKKALFYEASALILVHNHPSGNPTPSKSDIELTQQIILACKTVNVTIHDHVIICKSKFFSFKSNLLI